MFRYLISYNSSESAPYVIAVTAQKDMKLITVYSNTFDGQNWFASASADYILIDRHFVSCKPLVELYKRSSFEIIKNNHIEHKKYHSNDVKEKTIFHTHFKMKNRLTSDVFNNFWEAVHECELPRKKIHFLPSSTYSKMNTAFKKYENKNHNLVDSNDEHYNSVLKRNGTFPTIGEHFDCMQYSYNGCRLDNPLLMGNVPSTNSNLMNTSITGVIAMIGIFAYKLLKARAKPQIPDQSRAAIPKKSR